MPPVIISSRSLPLMARPAYSTPHVRTLQTPNTNTTLSTAHRVLTAAPVHSEGAIEVVSDGGRKAKKLYSAAPALPDLHASPRGQSLRNRRRHTNTEAWVNGPGQIPSFSRRRRWCTAGKCVPRISTCLWGKLLKGNHRRTMQPNAKVLALLSAAESPSTT